MLPGFRYTLPVLIAAGCAWSQGGSAIITLVMPPPGGDGYSALQTGAAFPEGAASLYYNPALLPWLQRSTGSQSFITNSHQNLLPLLGLSGLSQTFLGAAAVLPDPREGWDLGVGFFHNHVDFGTDQTAEPKPFDTHEEVYALGIGVRPNLPLSLGVTAKYIFSRLAFPSEINPSDPHSGLVSSWAFDAGLSADPRLSLPEKLGLPYAEAYPSFSYGVRNIGPNVFYDDS